MQIRFAQINDVQAIYDIYCPYILKTAITFETEVPAFDQFQKRFLAISCFYPWLVAEENGEILGYAYASRAFERAAYDWCVDLAIYFKMDHLHHGGARLLYETLMELLLRQHIRIVYAIITEGNEKSIRFHERMSFHKAGCLSKSGYKFGEWHDVVWMEKMLYEPCEPKPICPIQEVTTLKEQKGAILKER